MNLLRALRSILSLGHLRPRCLFCRARLDLGRGSTVDVTHFDCPRCGREFERAAHGRLQQHWRTPLKEALFLASRSSGSLASLTHVQGVWRDSVVEEVERELAHPTRQLTALFQYASPRSEDELREYLRVCVQPRTVEPAAVESLER